MKVYKRAGSPYWYASFTDPVTEARTKVCLKINGTRAEAELAAMRLVVARAPAPPPPPEPALQEPITLGTAISTYCTSIERAGRVGAGPARALGAKVLRGDNGTRGHLDRSMELHTLTSRTLSQLVTARTREGASPSAIKTEMTFLRAVLKQADREGFKVNRSLLDGTRKDAWKVLKALTALTKVRAVTLDEFLKVRDWLTPPPTPPRTPTARRHIATRFQDAQDVLVVLALTGAHWGDVRGLCWDMVDGADLQAWRQWKEAGTGAGRPVVKVEGGRRKMRTIECPDIACEVLERRWRTAKARRDARSKPGDPTGPVFVTKVTQAGDKGIAGRLIARAMKACGLNAPALVKEHGKATTASLKDTFAGLVTRPDGKAREIRKSVGKKTAKAAVPLSLTEQKEAAAKLAGILNAVTLRMGA